MKGMKGMGTDIKNIDFQGVDLSRLSFLFLLSLFIWFLSPVSPSSLLNSALAAFRGTVLYPWIPGLRFTRPGMTVMEVFTSILSYLDT